MPERGGPTTQSGILFQNSVTALYLGALTDESARPDHQRVVRVRVETSDAVDDLAITYADEHVAYVHVKEKLREDHTAWRNVWRDFATQFVAREFVRGRDRLRLHTGELHDTHDVLRDACDRARTSEGPARWRSRLTAAQTRLIAEVEALLGPSLPGEDEVLWAFFTHLEIESWPLLYLERDLVRHWMPATNLLPIMLFRLLRDRVGGEARVRGLFEARMLRESLSREGGVEFHQPIDTEVLRTAIKNASTLLRQHKHTLGSTGVHLERAIVRDIASWAMDPDTDRPVAMLLDQAGSGKTVVMRDVQAVLEDRGATVLGLKADQQLTGITTPEELQQRLGLPEPVERICGRLAALGPVVVLVDQVDALSLSLARDQQTLNVVLDLIGRMRVVPGVRVILSCRTFDRNTDPRLKRIDLGREFSLRPLSDAEVASVVEAIGVHWEALTPGTKELLRAPLHLDLFTRVAQTEGGPARLDGIGSLQQLYSLLWEEIILRPDPDGPPPADRERVLRIVAERMARQQRTSIPRSLLYTPQAAGLERAVDRLASAGVLIGGPEEWTFLHQTFFDYCYARFFVVDGRRLAETVLASDQGLFTRPQLVQVLTYLRGSGDPAYLRELSALLTTDRLRLHLRELLLRWFGGLPDPSEDEWLLARRLLASHTERQGVLGAMGGSPGWFLRLQGGVLDELLADTPTFVDDVVVRYLASHVNNAQAEVAAITEPWLQMEEPWPQRLHYLLLNIRKWGPFGIRMYERYLASLPLEDMRELYELDDIAKVDIAAGARLVRFVLDRVLERFEAKLLDEQVSMFRGLGNDLEILNGSGTAQAIDLVSKEGPAEFLEQMMPWLERAITIQEPSLPDFEGDSYYHISDPLSSGWHDTNVIHHQLMEAFIRALSQLARTDIPNFRRVSNQLAASLYATPHRLLANAYREIAADFADEALRYLAADPRRLDLGENQAYETRKLIEAAEPYASDEAVKNLEDVILTHAGNIRSYYRISLALQWRGASQMHLLRSFSRQRLSPRGQRTLSELERKFPNLVASDRPGTIMMRWGGSPIDYAATDKMSDRAWLRAMAKYTRGVQRKDSLRGGARELAGLLSGRVKTNPERFFKLAQRVPSDVDDHYAGALIRGLAESECPPEWVYSLVHRFAYRERREIRREITSSLEQVVRRAGALPPNILDMLGQWVREPPGEDELNQSAREQDLHHVFINTLRGEALEALMRSYAAENTGAAQQARWEWIEYLTNDSSVVLRSGAILELTDLLQDDHQRAIHLFDRLVKGFPQLRDSWSFHEFLNAASFGHYGRLGMYVEEVMNANKPSSRQRGAELATIAYISPRGLESDEARALAQRLVDQAVTGQTECRRGAARVFAHNFASGPTDLCVQGLRGLLNDEADDVCREVSWIVHEFRSEHRELLREFLLEFAGSKSGLFASHDLAEFLWEHGLLDPDWALTIGAALLSNAHSEQPRRGLGGGEELVRLVLRIYTDPLADEALRERAMDTFDRLMEQRPYHAVTALNEWDRR